MSYIIEHEISLGVSSPHSSSSRGFPIAPRVFSWRVFFLSCVFSHRVFSPFRAFCQGVFERQFDLHNKIEEETFTQAQCDVTGPHKD
jgi:hypothetical protein